MKRIYLLFIVILVLFSGCKKNTPAETLPTELEQPTESTVENVPELEYAIAQVNGIPAVLKTLSRGETLDVVGSYDERHYTVKLDNGYGLVEKNLIRMNTDAAFVPWTGYAYPSAMMYDNYRLAGTAAVKLATNDKVQVLDDLGWCYLVEWGGTMGYMKQECLAKSPLTNNRKDGTSDASKNNNGNAGQDGGEISLQSAGNVTLLSTIIPQEGTVKGKATVLADETQVVLGYFDRGDRIPVVKQSVNRDVLLVYLDGIYTEVSAAYVQTSNEEAFAEWEGRTKQIVSVYSDFWMLGSPSDRLNANTPVKVLCELENCYLVEVDGVEGYMKKGDVVAAAPTKETTPAETEPTEPTKPTESTQPTEATNPTEPTSPTEATEDESQGTDKVDPEWTPPIL